MGEMLAKALAAARARCPECKRKQDVYLAAGTLLFCEHYARGAVCPGSHRVWPGSPPLNIV